MSLCLSAGVHDETTGNRRITLARPSRSGHARRSRDLRTADTRSFRRRRSERRDPPHVARIPHIKATTFYGAAYGYGYAFAQDNLCEIAETYVTVNGERSRFFGPDGTYESRGNGGKFNNLDSD